MLFFLNVCIDIICDMCRCVCMPVLVIILIESCHLFIFEWNVLFEKVKCMLQWQKVTYRERVDSQWQKANRGIPQWQKVECWYPIRVVLKGRWDSSWFKNPHGVVPLPNQPNLFLILRIIYVFVIQKSNHSYLYILHHFYWWPNIYLIAWSVGSNILNTAWGA